MTPFLPNLLSATAGKVTRRFLGRRRRRIFLEAEGGTGVQGSSSQKRGRLGDATLPAARALDQRRPVELRIVAPYAGRNLVVPLCRGFNQKQKSWEIPTSCYRE